ncbi:ABC-2 type transporter-domain-containing protein [Chytriomyces sp. MP71]|nr:ABC-2 type transporter-domain-containing protein [Chytriomyces sp. MP71]
MSLPAGDPVDDPVHSEQDDLQILDLSPLASTDALERFLSAGPSVEPPLPSHQPLPDSLYQALKKDVEEQTLSAQSTHDMRALHDQVRDPRVDPASDQFDHTAWLKVVRAYVKSQHMDFSEMPIAFQDLKVIGHALTETEIPTVGSTLLGVLQPAIQVYRFLKDRNETLFRPKKGEKEIIKGITGAVKPGELVLVIGRPGSGCSSLLRTLANQTRTFKEIRGEISYGGFSSKEMREKYRDQIVYAQEDDPHFPSLTVRQTLEFALSCKLENPEIINKILNVTLKLYGLVGCQNTVVGNEMLRGVSGGEKKRVSLAEATVVGGSAGIFDGCTKGLDAASSLDFVRALRSFADFQNRAVVASCYQASDAMFQLFDKVIVLADGECTYFGPVNDAVQYFEERGFPKHPRDTAAEYLTTCASSGKISPADLGAQYRSSLYGTAAARDANYYFIEENVKLNRNAFLESHARRKVVIGNKGAKSDNVFAVSMKRQATLLIKREWQILRGNPVTIIVKYAVSIIMALLNGLVYLQLGTSPSDGYTRGGTIFFALLFNSTSAMSEVTKILDGRPILYKHTEMALHRPSTLFMAQFLFQVALDFIQLLIFSCILYFMVGLQATATKFFTFVLALFITCQAFGNIIRVFAYLASEKSVATQNAGIYLISNVIYSGYMIPHQYMKPWFVWIYWINPAAYGFKTMMINEFDGISFACAAKDMIPAGPTYTQGAYQTCSMSGATAGSTTVEGLSYLSTALDIDGSFKWWNLLINLALFILAFCVNCLVLDNVQHGKAGLSLKLYKPPEDVNSMQKRLQRMDKKVAPEESNIIEIESEQNEDKIAFDTLVWQNVVYTVPHPKKKGETLQLLDHISGYAKPGTLTALIGSSGAGKTTLLDVIAMRKTIGKIDGSICVENHPQGPEFKKISGYCEQMDVHNKHATVREALRFAAFLRQPASVTASEKMAYVDRVLLLLEMTQIADALIGDLDSGIGLSMEERKRLTIGIELVSKPRVLFLDEPTSGLDAQAASNIVKLLRNLAQEGYALIVTIHQPSAMLFREFDRLLLLGRGGKTIYFGELGHECQTLINYFERSGSSKCLPHENPAEYILECIGAGTAKTNNLINWFDTWKVSPECQHERTIIQNLMAQASAYAERNAVNVANESKKLIKDTPSPATKLGWVMVRMFRSYWRNPSYNIGRIIFQIMAALLIGLSFFQCEPTPGGAQNRIFAMFLVSVLGVVVINLVVPVFIDQRAYSLREQTTGAYGPLAFALAMTTVEIPFAIIAATIFYVLFYWTVGLNNATESAGYFYVMLIAFTLWAVSFGQMVASAVPSLGLASAIVPLMTSILSLFCGVTIPYDSMPGFFKVWLYWIDPYHYFIEGLIVNDLHNVALHCDSYSFINVNIPSGMTCGAHFTQYTLHGAPGLVRDPNAMNTCQWCPVQLGDTYFTRFSWNYDNRWKNVGYIFSFWVFNRLMTTVFVKRFKVKR